jgi:hypothetical protein
MSLPSLLSLSPLDRKSLADLSDDPLEGEVDPTVVAESVRTTNAPRYSALQLLEHILKTEPTRLQFGTNGNSRTAGNGSRPAFFTDQMIRNRGLRRAQEQKHDAFFYMKTDSTNTIDAETFTFKPSVEDESIQTACLTKIPALQLLDYSLCNNIRDNQTMFVLWCDGSRPGGTWLRCGQNSRFDQEETDAFTSTSLFLHCLPNELAYQLPLRENGAFWIPFVKLYRTAEGKGLPAQNVPYSKKTFAATLLPWVAKPTNVETNNSHLFSNQMYLVLQLAYIHNIDHVVISLERWSKEGFAPVEIAQRFVQCLSKFCEQHPTNILFLQKLKISFSIRSEVHNVWLLSFQSVLASDARSKDEQKRERAAKIAQLQQEQQQRRNTLQDARRVDSKENNDNKSARMSVQQQTTLNRTMSAARRLLSAERSRNERERSLYMQRPLSASSASSSSTQLSNPSISSRRENPAVSNRREQGSRSSRPRYQFPTFSSSQKFR